MQKCQEEKKSPMSDLQNGEGFKRERVCEAILRESLGKEVFGCQVELFFYDPQPMLPCVQYGDTTVVGLAIKILSRKQMALTQI